MTPHLEGGGQVVVMPMPLVSICRNGMLVDSREESIFGPKWEAVHTPIKGYNSKQKTSHKWYVLPAKQKGLLHISGHNLKVRICSWFRRGLRWELRDLKTIRPCGVAEWLQHTSTNAHGELVDDIKTGKLEHEDALKWSALGDWLWYMKKGRNKKLEMMMYCNMPDSPDYHIWDPNLPMKAQNTWCYGIHWHTQVTSFLINEDLPCWRT